MKLNRWELDTLYNLVASEVRRVSVRRRELLNTLGDDTELRRQLADLILLKTKLDRLRKGHDMKGTKNGTRNRQGR